MSKFGLIFSNRTRQEYIEANREQIGLQKKIYYEANKQTLQHKKKTYYEANKQVFAQKNKTYRLANKQVIEQKKKQLIQCECGSQIRRSVIARHKRSTKHNQILTAKLFAVLPMI